MSGTEPSRDPENEHSARPSENKSHERDLSFGEFDDRLDPDTSHLAGLKPPPTLNPDTPQAKPSPSPSPSTTDINSNEDAKPDGGYLKTSGWVMAEAWRSSKWDLVARMACVGGSAALPLILYKIIGAATDNLITAAAKTSSIVELTKAASEDLGKMVTFGFLAGASILIGNHIQRRLANRMERRIESQLGESLDKKPFVEIQKEKLLSALQLSNQHIYRMTNYLESQLQVVTAIATGVVIAGGLIAQGAPLGLLVGLAAVPLILSERWHSSRSAKLQKELEGEHMMQGYQKYQRIHPDSRAELERLSRTSQWTEEIVERSAAITGKQERLSLGATARRLSAELIQRGLMSAGLVGLCHGVQGGSMSPGTLLALWSVCTVFQGELTSLFTSVARQNEHRPLIEELRRKLSANSENTLTRKELVDFSKGAPTITFDDVRFSRESVKEGGKEPSVTRNEVLKGLSMTLRPGEYVALFAANGAGKTTLLDILSGLLRPDSGSVRINGVNLSELDREQWQSGLGITAQNFTVFAGKSLMENLALSTPRREALSEERLIEAMASTGFTKVLGESEGTLSEEGRTKLSEPCGAIFGGKEYSGGERQLLANTRTALRDSWIIVADEAASALDVWNRTKFLDWIRDHKLKNGMPVTRIMVTHDPAVLAEVDRVIVIEGGKVTAEGTYAELLKQNGSLVAEAYKLAQRSLDRK